MRTKKRRKPKLTKAELYETSSGLDGIGDILVMMGELEKREKEMKNIDKLMRKLFRICLKRSQKVWVTIKNRNYLVE